ncbi:MAG: Lrp/AsnC family transcriptional regulator [Eubacteriales bacterium]|nr:Lrp/AsnC family transcriptional regulator [Eubacteriales bacterium]
MRKELDEKILKLLATNSRLTDYDLSLMLNVPQEEIYEEIAYLEQEHIICGYRTLIDWNKVSEDDVTALVELRVTPQGGDGYQKLADKIKNFPQVETLYLMSGAYDFLVTIKGKSIKEISLFISGKLASIEEVQSTTTHFTLTKYKELGVSFEEEKDDKRMVVTP